MNQTNLRMFGLPHTCPEGAPGAAVILSDNGDREACLGHNL